MNICSTSLQLPSPLNLADHSDTFSDVTRNDGIVVVVVAVLLQEEEEEEESAT